MSFHDPEDDGGWDIGRREMSNKWKVWFAWYPVRCEVGRKMTVVHDEVATERKFKRRWLCNVSRRRAQPLHHGDWEYAPAHKALTQ